MSSIDFGHFFVKVEHFVDATLEASIFMYNSSVSFAQVNRAELFFINIVF